MKLSDYVFKFLADKGLKDMLYLPGGGCMHLLDSLGGSVLKAYSLLHEQAVAVACEAQAGYRNSPAAALLTTGPGGSNAITGILAAYLDSAPCFFITGQVKRNDLKSRYGVRSLGSQEADIVTLAGPVTKYAAMIEEPEKIRYHLERAWHEMITHRRGPVLIDIPLDVQAAQIDEASLKGFTPPQPSNPKPDISAMIEMVNKAKRPVIIAGHGLATLRDEFWQLADLLGWPIIPSWKFLDIISNDHPLYAGRAGGMGDRHGNLTMQNSDLILSLGCRLDFSITGYDRNGWAPRADKIVVDIDPAELGKLEKISRIFPVEAEAGEVIASLLARRGQIHSKNLNDWHNHIAHWKERYPVTTSKKYSTSAGRLTTYALVDTLSGKLGAEAVIAPCSSGTTAEIFFQAFQVKSGQKIRSNHGLGAMGFEIPNAIGLCLASEKQTICIAGDGGMQLNIQELSVVRGLNLPIKIFVVNNNGYASIRNMQNNHFQGRLLGCDQSSGLFLPKIKNLAEAYSLPFFRLENSDDLETVIESVLIEDGPAICEAIVDSDCIVTPRAASCIMPDGSMRSSPLENQFPFLSDEEAQVNQLIN